MSVLIAGLLGSVLSPAFADQTVDPGPDPLLPVPMLRYDRPPPDYSYELGFRVSYGSVARWTQEIPMWVGFGLHGGWGRNLPDSYQHRLGASVLAFVEGPLPIHMTAGIEPHFTWDWIGKKKLLLGAGLGGAVMYHSKIVSGSNILREAGLGASGALRIGYSQTWSRVGRRPFVVFETRFRYLNPEQMGPSFHVVIGSGKGY